MQTTTADQFLDLACLTHTRSDTVGRRDQAEAILAASPWLIRDDAYVAAAVGDIRALREHLDRDADAATQRGGPRGWDALLYLCNARIAPRASWDPLACARLLLDHGADPKTHAFMYQMPYTAITGAVGVGEAGPVAAPPHPQARALVELLLDAGADPNDEQALYNVHFLRDEGWLELLLARGLREQVRLDYLLGASVKQGVADRVALLLAHGASPNGRDFYNKRTHLENALLRGHDLIAKMLVNHGAAAPSFSPGEGLRVACLRGHEEQIRHLTTAALEGRDDEATLVVAAQHGNLRAVRLCLDVLGVPVDATNDDGLTALHTAAGNGQRLVVDELLSRGASLTIRDPVHRGTPTDHARWVARTWPSPERADVARVLEAAAAQRPPGSGG
ncbi:MAG TPA: ankyrin repeat domain-containing protein [Burkholderiales bacterium]|nr:ankyrin repeat domain-containing protein [Burkholderiales bacterium]